METRRLALIAVLGVILFFMYQAWEQDYAPHPAVPAVSQNGSAPKAPDVVTVSTGVMRARIDLQGGSISRLLLLRYPLDKDHPARKLALLDRTAERQFVYRPGAELDGKPLLGKQTQFTVAQDQYQLGADQKTLTVPLTATTADGGKLTLQYRFHRNSYEIDQELIYDNAGQRKVELRSVPALVSNDKPAGEPQKFLHTFFGLGVYELHDGSYRFEKKDFSDVAKKAYDHDQHGGWIAFLQQYFLGAVIPPANKPVQIFAKPAGDGLVSAGYVGEPVGVAAGGRATLSTRLYIGPKLQDRLDSVAPGLGLTQDYGLFTIIAKPLFWVLSKFHALTGNWGVAIVLLTLLVRGAFFKLSEAQYRSMAKMRKFGPRIKELRERYAGDRERQSKAMMELYKKEGFNPLAGCWPIVIQIPVFIALYWVLAESVELRQAPFMLWMQDLSAPDPYYILPALYALTMFVQQRISGQTATMDPAQQRLMSIMPIGLFGMFAFFPQGLVLYWVVSNSFTLLQQWVIMRRLDREGLGRSG